MNPAYLQLRKYLRSYPEWRFAPPRVQVDRQLHRVGSGYGGYYVDPSTLGRDAVVYSLGVGEDISFDLAVIEQYGAAVHAFDPTPKVKNWLASQTLPEQFFFENVGIAHLDGEAIFYLPSERGYVSHSTVRAKEFSSNSIRVPMIRLSTAMRHRGHDRIDVLKMDIEGEEYAVLEDLVRERIPVRQLLIEFHHRFSSIGTEKTKEALATLEGYGFRVCYMCPRMQIFTFVRTA